MYFIISIDTEEDMPQWKPERKITVSNIKGIPKLQKLFLKYGVKPTYLINEPVIKNDESQLIIKNVAQEYECEIGLHLHSWNTPPLTDGELEGKATVLNNHPQSIQKEKLFNIHNLFYDRLGFYPTSYRAGRYGLTSFTLDILAELGFTVDSSVVPLTDYSGYSAPNYEEYDNNPFWIKTKNNQPLLEIPLSVSQVSKIPEKLQSILFGFPEWMKIKGIMHRLNISRRLWLRPTTYSFNEMKQLANHIEQTQNIPIYNLMFHSSEIWPGASPYNTSQRDVQSFIERLELIIEYLVQQKGVQPVTMSEYYHIAKSKHTHAYTSRSVTL